MMMAIFASSEGWKRMPATSIDRFELVGNPEHAAQKYGDDIQPLFLR